MEIIPGGEIKHVGHLEGIVKSVYPDARTTIVDDYRLFLYLLHDVSYQQLDEDLKEHSMRLVFDIIVM